MLKAVREYLSFAGVQYCNPDKAGDEREKMLTLRRKGQEARKAFTELVKTFQASHPEWQLQQTSQWRKKMVMVLMPIELSVKIQKVLS